MIFEFRIIQIANRIVKIRGSGCSASRRLSGGSFFHPPTPGLPLSFTRPLISPNFLRFVGGESSGTKGCHLLTCANSSASRDASRMKMSSRSRGQKLLDRALSSTIARPTFRNSTEHRVFCNVRRVTLKHFRLSELKML